MKGFFASILAMFFDKKARRIFFLSICTIILFILLQSVYLSPTQYVLETAASQFQQVTTRAVADGGYAASQGTSSMVDVLFGDPIIRNAIFDLIILHFLYALGTGVLFLITTISIRHTFFSDSTRSAVVGGIKWFVLFLVFWIFLFLYSLQAAIIDETILNRETNIGLMYIVFLSIFSYIYILAVTNKSKFSHVGAMLKKSLRIHKYWKGILFIIVFYIVCNWISFLLWYLSTVVASIFSLLVFALLSTFVFVYAYTKQGGRHEN
ncbi:MAG: hypothetical protein ACI8Y7_000107 [Candidatus Woesearchaeota archaeon]|jgi:hypothetical protein